MPSFILILFSALMHSLWNLALKKSEDKYVFNFMMHIVGLAIFTVVYPVFFPEALLFDWESVIYGAAAAVFFTLYHLWVATAYRYADVSQVYPVTTASPLFILIWAVLFLNEPVSLLGVLGILVTIGGTLMMNRVPGERFHLTKGVTYALLAAFAYSFGALLDKIGVTKTNIILNIYVMTLGMTICMYLYALRSKVKFTTYFRGEWKLILFGGVVIFLSFITYRFGLRGMEVSYATALRQVNALFGAALGVMLFGEKMTRYRVVGTLVIVLGVFLIRLGM